VHEDTAPVLRVEYKRATIKQYLKAGRALRTETTFNDPYDVDVGRSLPNLRRLVDIGNAINERLLAHERTGVEGPLWGP
jgi:hypothetical protein